jgi:hypothetical protein
LLPGIILIRCRGYKANFQGKRMIASVALEEVLLAAILTANAGQGGPAGKK